MEDWFVPAHQKQLANLSTKVFGYDQQGNISYDFNELGFRTGHTNGTFSINLIGNSISFGIGLDFDQTFGYMLATNLNRKLNNFSFGCYMHDNQDHLKNIKILATQDNNDIYIVQINNLDRQRIDPNLVISNNDQLFCKKRFLDYFDHITEILKSKTTIFLYWDNISYDLPKSITDQFLIFNNGHVDTSIIGNPTTFGIKTNLFILKVITSSIKAGTIPLR